MTQLPKLPAPIVLLIDIHIRTWTGREVANTYRSAKVYVNGAGDPSAVIAMQLGSSHMIVLEAFKILTELYGTAIPDLHYSELLAKGVILRIAERVSTKINCRKWGKIDGTL